MTLSTVGRQVAADADQLSDSEQFACLEKSVQAISLRIDSLAKAPPPPRIKEIETITVYKKVYEDDKAGGQVSDAS